MADKTGNSGRSMRYADKHYSALVVGARTVESVGLLVVLLGGPPAVLLVDACAVESFSLPIALLDDPVIACVVGLRTASR